MPLKYSWSTRIKTKNSSHRSRLSMPLLYIHCERDQMGSRLRICPRLGIKIDTGQKYSSCVYLFLLIRRFRSSQAQWFFLHISSMNFPRQRWVLLLVLLYYWQHTTFKQDEKSIYPMEQIRILKVTEKYLTELLLFFISKKQHKNEFLLSKKIELQLDSFVKWVNFWWDT